MVTQFYSDNSINRASHLREVRTSTISTKLFVPIWNNKILYDWDKGEVKVYKHIANKWKKLIDTIVFLGVYNGNEFYAIDISQIKSPDGKNLVLLELRSICPFLSTYQAAMLAYANGMITWHNNHKFCGSCSHTTRSQQKGHARICVNSECGRIHYPRIDPAIITLIEFKQNGKPAKCLLNKSKTENGYKCAPFAGFVEIGESLEDAVIREMKEEVGLDVYNIRYVISQPWPFPSSIMIGFIAQTNNNQFKLDNKEIKDAKWYSSKEIFEQVENGSLELSNEDSIARYLINHWASLNKS